MLISSQFYLPAKFIGGLQSNSRVGSENVGSVLKMPWKKGGPESGVRAEGGGRAGSPWPLPSEPRRATLRTCWPAPGDPAGLAPRFVDGKAGHGAIDGPARGTLLRTSGVPCPHACHAFAGHAGRRAFG